MGDDANEGSLPSWLEQGYVFLIFDDVLNGCHSIISFVQRQFVVKQEMISLLRLFAFPFRVFPPGKIQLGSSHSIFSYSPLPTTSLSTVTNRKVKRNLEVDYSPNPKRQQTNPTEVPMLQHKNLR